MYLAPMPSHSWGQYKQKLGTGNFTLISENNNNNNNIYFYSWCYSYYDTNLQQLTQLLMSNNSQFSVYLMELIPITHVCTYAHTDNPKT